MSLCLCVCVSVCVCVCDVVCVSVCMCVCVHVRSCVFSHAGFQIHGCARKRTGGRGACLRACLLARLAVLLEGSLLEDRLERGFYVLRDVLDEERPADPDAVFQGPQQLRVRHRRDLVVKRHSVRLAKPWEARRAGRTNATYPDGARMILLYRAARSPRSPRLAEVIRAYPPWILVVTHATSTNSRRPRIYLALDHGWPRFPAVTVCNLFMIPVVVFTTSTSTRRPYTLALNRGLTANKTEV